MENIHSTKLFVKRNHRKKWFLFQAEIMSMSKCISRKWGLMPCLKTILNYFALEQSAFKTKHLKVSQDMASDSIFLLQLLYVHLTDIDNRLSCTRPVDTTL